MVVSLQLKQQQTMTLTLTTTTTQQVEREIELPAFFQNRSIYYAALSDDMIIRIDDFQDIKYIGFGHATLESKKAPPPLGRAHSPWPPPN